MENLIDEGLVACLRMTEALLDAMEEAVRSSRSDNIWTYSSYLTFMRKSNELSQKANSIEQVDAPIDIFNIDKVPTMGNTTIIEQQAYFEAARANLQILKAYLANRVEPKERRVTGITDFLQSNLRRAMLHQPQRERDVQDAIEQLMIGRGMEKGVDYDREVGRVKVSSKEVIPDFIFPSLEMALEVKLLRDRSSLGTAIDEINVDIRAYLQGYNAVLFLVYDLGVVHDEVEFRRDLETTDGVRVLVVKH